MICLLIISTAWTRLKTSLPRDVVCAIFGFNSPPRVCFGPTRDDSPDRIAPNGPLRTNRNSVSYAHPARMDESGAVMIPQKGSEVETGALSDTSTVSVRLIALEHIDS